MTIRVTSYRNRCMQGTLGGAQFESDRAFSSGIDLLMQLEHRMDETNTPQRNEEPRGFSSASAQGVSKCSPAEQEKVKTLAVFQLNVMFRQNSTWQGSLLWVDAGQEAYFRSVLEMLRLMDSVLIAGEKEK